MKFILAWLGIVGATLGILSIVLQDYFTPEDTYLTRSESWGLLVVSIVFMFIGRRHLPAGLIYFFGQDHGDD
jgi:hypothetical protein